MAVYTSRSTTTVFMRELISSHGYTAKVYGRIVSTTTAFMKELISSHGYTAKVYGRIVHNLLPLTLKVTFPAVPPWILEVPFEGSSKSTPLVGLPPSSQQIISPPPGREAYHHRPWSLELPCEDYLHRVW
jgi:hypothetical protein